MIPIRSYAALTAFALVAAAILDARAFAADSDEIALPFELGKEYRYEISGEMSGSEKFRIVDATGPDAVKRYKLVSELDIKARNGAYRTHETSYVFDAKGRAHSYSGSQDAYYPDSPRETGIEKFLFEFSPGRVHARIERRGRHTWEANIVNLPREIGGAIDRDCISHLALALAGTSLGDKRRREKVTLFSFDRRELIMMPFKVKSTDKRKLWRKVEELAKVEYDIYDVPQGSFWIRLADRLLIRLSNQSETVHVELIPPE